MIRLRVLMWLAAGTAEPEMHSVGGLLRASGYEPNPRYPRGYRMRATKAKRTSLPKGARVYFWRDAQIQRRLRRRVS